LQYTAEYGKNSQMASHLNHERLGRLLQRLGFTDREIAARLRIDPATVWRLRHRKIAKIAKYITAAEQALGEAPATLDDPALEELLTQAQASPRLKVLLLSLRDALQEAARPSES
jgi:transcriptional regulator with XRE-family HTH domain